MKNNRTELVFILDRSGSMAGLESDTIGGFNSLLEKQKKEEGEAVVTTVLFDNQYELLHDRFDIHNVKPVTERDYYVRGNTALLDAVGKTISKIANVQRNAGDGEKAELLTREHLRKGFKLATMVAEAKELFLLEHSKRK